MAKIYKLPLRGSIKKCSEFTVNGKTLTLYRTSINYALCDSEKNVLHEFDDYSELRKILKDYDVTV